MLVREGRAQRPTLNLTTIVVDSHMANLEFLKSGVELLPKGIASGLLVAHATKGRSAYNAGIREGDIITHVNNIRAKRVGDLFRALGPVYIPDRKLDIRVWRPKGVGKGGATIEFTLTPMTKEDDKTAENKRVYFFS